MFSPDLLLQRLFQTDGTSGGEVSRLPINQACLAANNARPPVIPAKRHPRETKDIDLTTETPALRTAGVSPALCFDLQKAEEPGEITPIPLV